MVNKRLVEEGRDGAALHGSIAATANLVCAGCGRAITDLQTGYVTVPAPSSGRPPLEWYHEGCGRRDDRRESLRRFGTYLGSRQRGVLVPSGPSPTPSIAIRRAQVHMLAWKQQRTPQGAQIYVVRDATQLVYVGKTIHTVGGRLRDHLRAADAVGIALAQEIEQHWQAACALAVQLGHLSASSLPERADPVYVRALQHWVDLVPDQLWVEYRSVSDKPSDLDVLEQALIHRHQPLHNQQHRGTMTRWQRWHEEEGDLLAYRVRLLPATDRSLVLRGWPLGSDGRW